MSKNRMNDLSGLLGCLAGIANDTLCHVREKRTKVKRAVNAADEIEALKRKIEILEERLNKLETEK